MTKEDLLLLNSKYVKLLGLVRSQAVNIVDSFDLRDEILGSALGCYDGNVYQSKCHLSLFLFHGLLDVL